MISGIRAGKREQRSSSATTTWTTWKSCWPRRSGAPKVIAFESVYSMDGDIADMPGTVALAKKYGA
jgi:5-aminolevulinate synthase